MTAIPVLAFLTGAMTRSQYDTLRFTVNWARTHPSGAICHVASFDELGRVHIAELWESLDALNAYVAARLLPALHALRIDPPAIVVHALHSAQAYGAIERYRV